jgi:sec-independent protein translocase protein TatA
MGGLSLAHWIVVAGVVTVFFGRGAIKGLLTDAAEGIKALRHINDEPDDDA